MLLRMWDQDEKNLNKTFLQKPKALPESGDEKEEEATTGEEQIEARSRTEQSKQRRREKGLGGRRKSPRLIKFYLAKYRCCGR